MVSIEYDVISSNLVDDNAPLARTKDNTLLELPNVDSISKTTEG